MYRQPTNNELRAIFLTNPNKIKDLSIGPKAAEIYAFVYSDNDGVNSIQVAREFGISVANASAHLTKLYKQGYLNRYADTCKSGSVEYNYRGCVHVDGF